jgi:hypothetical protein
VLAFGAGVIVTIIGYVVANVLKPKEVDRVDGQIRSAGDQARSTFHK